MRLRHLKFKQMFTGRDNTTIDIARVLGFEIVQFYMAISIYSLYKGGSFDPLLWGAGIASIMASVGAAIGLKAGTEPQPTAISVTTKDGTSYSQKIGVTSSNDDSDGGGMPMPPPDKN